MVTLLVVLLGMSLVLVLGTLWWMGNPAVTLLLIALLCTVVHFNHEVTGPGVAPLHYWEVILFAFIPAIYHDGKRAILARVARVKAAGTLRVTLASTDASFDG